MREVLPAGEFNIFSVVVTCHISPAAMRKSWSRIWCGVACKKCKWFVEAMTGHTKCFECGEWCCAGLRRCHQRTIRPPARRLLCNANQNADASMQCFEPPGIRTLITHSDCWSWFWWLINWRVYCPAPGLVFSHPFEKIIGSIIPLSQCTFYWGI